MQLNSILKTGLGRLTNFSVFKTLRQVQTDDHEIFGTHVMELLKMIIVEYTKIRLYHIAKEETLGLNPPTVRNQLTKIDGSSCGESGEMSDEWFDRPDHPLLNILVLDIIFKQLRRHALKECRLVCKTWNVSTIPFTRKDFKVTIYANPNPKNKLRTIENFVEVFRRNILGIPFARFKLGSFCTRDGVGEEFLQLCGNTTKDIKFSKDIFRVEDLSELIKSTPKLEALEIPKRLQSSSENIVKLFPEDSKPRLLCLKEFTICLDNPKERNEFCPTFLEELITAVENISCVTLWDSFPASGEENYISSGFQVLSLIEKLGREKSVQELQLSLNKNNDSDSVELLCKMAAKQNGLKLKNLDYRPRKRFQDGEVLKVISLFKDSLESLKIDVEHFISFLECPDMPHLTRLQMNLYKDINFRFVNLRKKFPVLKSLHLVHIDVGQFVELFPESEPCPTIKTLYLRVRSLSINGINQIMRVFPNLIDFEIHIREFREEILGQIWTEMTQLESLTISGTVQTENSMDCVFTGISDHVLREIIDVVNSLGEMGDVERREWILNLRNPHSLLPSIGNLTRLTSFSSFGLTSNGEGKYLTDVTGYLGFYSMKNLKAIGVDKCELTKACSEILTKDMGLEFCKIETV